MQAVLSNHVGAALDELRSERVLVVDRVEKLRSELDESTTQLARLDKAIESLELLIPSDTETSNDSDRENGLEIRPVPHPDSSSDMFMSHNAEDDELIRRYLPRGGSGKRLRSTRMVADLLAEIGGPVTRDYLREAFFGIYGRDKLEKYWDRPENALNTAINRAIIENIIGEAKGENGKTVVFSLKIHERPSSLPDGDAEER